MKKSDLVVGTMYAYAQGNDTPEPARLLDLRLWKLRGGRRSDPDAWEDVTGSGARPGGAGAMTTNTSMIGYLVLTGTNYRSTSIAEDITAVEVPPLPEDPRAAARVLADVVVPHGMYLELVVTGNLRKPWTDYVRDKVAHDAEGDLAKRGAP
ncbi:hypothetical protein ACWD7M_16170 [Streptomyces griseus]